MSEVDFTVTDVFDITSRGGLLVAGSLASGDIGSGDVLYDSVTGAPVRVIGLEFHGGGEPGQFILVVDRADTDHVRVGQHLIDQPNPTASTNQRS
ncbi:hypothetical protein [Nocardia amamiensis]|uniref:hypothetical protein n=1 Tax=Nocardia amamiensis TaxID=404578 RepID=UPI0008366943|nr:hypothetical protein [Nocardia amamiensis]